MEDDVDTSSTKQLVQFLETADEWSNVAEIVPTFKGNTDTFPIYFKEFMTNVLMTNIPYKKHIF